MKRALRYGATKQESLETIEATLIVCGAATFALGLRALIRVEKDEEEKAIQLSKGLNPLIKIFMV